MSEGLTLTIVDSTLAELSPDEMKDVMEAFGRMLAICSNARLRRAQRIQEETAARPKLGRPRKNDPKGLDNGGMIGSESRVAADHRS